MASSAAPVSDLVELVHQLNQLLPEDKADSAKTKEIDRLKQEIKKIHVGMIDEEILARFKVGEENVMEKILADLDRRRRASSGDVASAVDIYPTLRRDIFTDLKASLEQLSTALTVAEAKLPPLPTQAEHKEFFAKISQEIIAPAQAAGLSSIHLYAKARQNKYDIPFIAMQVAISLFNQACNMLNPYVCKQDEKGNWRRKEKNWNTDDARWEFANQLKDILDQRYEEVKTETKELKDKIGSLVQFGNDIEWANAEYKKINEANPQTSRLRDILNNMSTIATKVKTQHGILMAIRDNKSIAIKITDKTCAHFHARNAGEGPNPESSRHVTLHRN